MSKQNNGTLYVLGHLDLGDSIVMNGLIRSLLDDWGKVVWFVKPEYVPAVSSMMSDCATELAVLPAEGGYDDPAAKWLPSYLNVLRLGYFHRGTFDALHWDYEFYRQAKVPFDYRWDAFKHAQDRGPWATWGKRDQAVIHERPEVNFRINRGTLPAKDLVFLTPGANSPWDYIRPLYESSEIHVVDSAFLCLADSLDFRLDKSTRLVFHAYAKTYPGIARWPALKKNWEIIL